MILAPRYLPRLAATIGLFTTLLAWPISPSSRGSTAWRTIPNRVKTMAGRLIGRWRFENDSSS
jgi:hypothetical protein